MEKRVRTMQICFDGWNNHFVFHFTAGAIVFDFRMCTFYLSLALALCVCLVSRSFHRTENVLLANAVSRARVCANSRLTHSDNRLGCCDVLNKNSKLLYIYVDLMAFCLGHGRLNKTLARRVLSHRLTFPHSTLHRSSIEPQTTQLFCVVWCFSFVQPFVQIR